MVQRIAGKLLEAHFGPGVMPETAFRDADDLYRRMASLGSKPSGFSFGSVRMQQGEVYKRRPGALVVEIDATARGVGPSGNDFDEYDRSLVDLTIYNTGTELDFRKHVATCSRGWVLRAWRSKSC